MRISFIYDDGLYYCYPKGETMNCIYKMTFGVVLIALL